MNRSILVAFVCAAGLAACGRTIIREERVVEQPVSTPAPTIVERPAVAIAAPSECTIAGSLYASGTLSCQGGYQYRCTSGAWERIPGSYC